VNEVIRPGPNRLPAHLAPGGLVLRVYDTAGGGLVLERFLTPDELNLTPMAEADAAFTSAVIHGDPCLVVYDGDTGDRWHNADYLRMLGFEPG